MARSRFKMPDGETMLAQLEALAAQARGPRRVPRAHIEKIEATKAKNRKARQKAITDRWHAQKRAKHMERRKPFGATWPDRCVRAMVPGEWYADRDLQNATGCDEDQPVQWEAMNQGLIEKRRNPDWTGPHVEMQAPKFLYRLTRAGESRRELCRLLD